MAYITPKSFVAGCVAFAGEQRASARQRGEQISSPRSFLHHVLNPPSFLGHSTDKAQPLALLHHQAVDNGGINLVSPTRTRQAWSPESTPGPRHFLLTFPPSSSTRCHLRLLQPPTSPLLPLSPPRARPRARTRSTLLPSRVLPLPPSSRTPSSTPSSMPRASNPPALRPPLRVARPRGVVRAVSRGTRCSRRRK